MTVTVPVAFADKWLLHRLEAFYRLQPACELRIDTNTTLVDFSTQAIDVGIRHGAGSWPGLPATLFACDEFFPVCSPSLLEGPKALRIPADLGQHQLVHDTSMASTAEFPKWRDWFKQAGLSPNDSDRGVHINDSAAAYRTAIAINGVALGRTTLVEQDLAEKRLAVPFGPPLSCALGYYVVCRPQDFKDKLISAFREWLVAEAAPAKSPPSRTA